MVKSQIDILQEKAGGCQKTVSLCKRCGVFFCVQNRRKSGCDPHRLKSGCDPRLRLVFLPKRVFFGNELF
ncbi:MAG: hypothetical protein RR317_02930, partial [Bilophila sp.]